MKIFFQILLIFLFISCGGGSKTPVDDDSAAVVPDSDKDIEDVLDDEERIDEDYEDPENNDEGKSDDHSESKTGPCKKEPCKNVENSNGECIAIGNIDYVCGCEKGYAWFGKEEGCLSIKIKDIYGAVCTGQTKCYDMEKEIPCPKDGEPFYGQDAQYAKAEKCIPRNYTVKQYDDGETVVDNNTGLEWQRGFESDTGPVGAISFCSSLNLGGNNWRIPSPNEQFTIIDARYFNPIVDETYFPDTPPEFFYSSYYKMVAGFNNRDFYFEGVDFEYGTIKHYFETDHPSPFPDGGLYDEFESGYIRCVRSQTEDTSCTMRILTTNLTTDEYSIRLDISNNLVITNIAEQGKNWKEALDYCENLTYAGISDWRLPNRNEIRFFSLPATTFWTSTTAAHDPTQAVALGVDPYYTDYSYSYSENTPLQVSFYSKEGDGDTFCVASNPCGEGKLWTGKKCVTFADLGIDDAGC